MISINVSDGVNDFNIFFPCVVVMTSEYVVYDVWFGGSGE